MNSNLLKRIENLNINKKYNWKKCKTDFNGFVTVCKLPQNMLKTYLKIRLGDFFKPETIVDDDGFLYVKGDIPIVVTAHMDTVHKKQCTNFLMRKENETHIVTSPNGIGGDDRCGVHIILKLLEKGYRPYVLFCEDEEKGGIGSGKFCKFPNLVEEIGKCKYIIELDRANAEDSVYYDCDNKDFEDYINKVTEYDTSFGSFSDISTLCPSCGIAGVNLSCGYYNAHTTDEYVVVEEMEHTIEVVENLLKDEGNVKQFEYVEKIYSRFGRYSGYFGYDEYDDYYDSYFNRHYEPTLSKDKKSEEKSNDDKVVYSFLLYDETVGDMEEAIYDGSSFYECLGKCLEEYCEYSYANNIIDFHQYK